MMAPRQSATNTRTQKDDTEFRRADDIERLAKLEYVVYEDHEGMLLTHDREIKIIGGVQQEIKNYLKNIKNILIAFLVGAAASQIGWANLAKILSAFIVI